MCMRVYMSTRVLLRSCMWRAEKGGQELLLQRGRGDPPQGSLCGGGRRDGAAPPPPPCPGNGPTCPALPPGVRGPRGWAAWPRSPSQFAEGPSARPRSRPGPWGAAPSSRGPGWAGAGAPDGALAPDPLRGAAGFPGRSPVPGLRRRPARPRLTPRRPPLSALSAAAPPPPGPGRRRDGGARRERPDCAARPEERRGRRGSPSAGLAQQLPPGGRVTSAPASGARRGGARSPSTMRPLSARGAPPSG